MGKTSLVIFFLLFNLSGCSGVIPKDVLEEVDTAIDYARLSKEPSALSGKTVLLGGVVVRVVNQDMGSVMVVYETEMDAWHKPINTDSTRGRFVVFSPGRLEPAIYEKGRKVTIVGTVEGEKTMYLEKGQETYPYIYAKHIYLWRKEPEYIHYFDPYYDPWYYYGPSWPWFPYMGVGTSRYYRGFQPFRSQTPWWRDKTR